MAPKSRTRGSSLLLLQKTMAATGVPTPFPHPLPFRPSLHHSRHTHRLHLLFLPPRDQAWRGKVGCIKFVLNLRGCKRGPREEILRSWKRHERQSIREVCVSCGASRQLSKGSECGCSQREGRFSTTWLSTQRTWMYQNK